jgi:hypothetical protein
MADTWDIVRQAVVAKLDGATGIRRATADVDEPLQCPEIRVMNPDFELLQQTGNTERYILTFPFEIVVSRPAGMKRSNVIASDLARAVQERFFTGVSMSGVVSSPISIEDARLGTMVPGLTDYAEQDADGREKYDGYRGTVIVQVYETLTRTA